ncbi:MAG: EamA family transporter [Candidatus Thorarchaeota archaeon]
MEFIGELAAIGNMVFSGIATVIVKSQGKDIKPTALILIQAIVSSVSFIVIVSAMGSFLDMFKIPWQALLLLIGAALFGIIFGNFIYFTSLQLIGVSKAYPISMTYPLLTYILEVIIFPEVTFNWLKLIGIVVVIIGVVFISLSKVNNNNINQVTEIPEINESISPDEKSIDLMENDENKITELKIQSIEKQSIFKSKMVIGIILALITTITWSSGTIMIKYGLTIIDNDIAIIPINAARMTLLVPFSVVIFFSANRGNNKSKFTWKSILLVSVAAILSLVVSNILYLISINLIGASTPAAIAASGPLIATPISILFLKEKVDWKIILGTLFTIGGIIMIIFLG